MGRRGREGVKGKGIVEEGREWEGRRRKDGRERVVGRGGGQATGGEGKGRQMKGGWERVKNLQRRDFRECGVL